MDCEGVKDKQNPRSDTYLTQVWNRELNANQSPESFLNTTMNVDAWIDSGRVKNLIFTSKSDDGIRTDILTLSMFVFNVHFLLNVASIHSTILFAKSATDSARQRHDQLVNT